MSIYKFNYDIFYLKINYLTNTFESSLGTRFTVKPLPSGFTFYVRSYYSFKRVSHGWRRIGRTGSMYRMRFDT